MSLERLWQHDRKHSVGKLEISDVSGRLLTAHTAMQSNEGMSPYEPVGCAKTLEEKRIGREERGIYFTAMNQSLVTGVGKGLFIKAAGNTNHAFLDTKYGILQFLQTVLCRGFEAANICL